MNEHLLQYLWNYKIFTSFDFKDIHGNKVEILEFGEWNYNSGPDFLLSKIKVNDLEFIGNVELHLKSSDWDNHKHSENSNFENVILHVVYEHDKTVDFIEDRNIPTIELKHHISEETLLFYTSTFSEQKTIPCEDVVQSKYLPFQFSEKKVIEKLNAKAESVETDLKTYKNDYEAVLFHHLAYAFGLKINALTFKSLAEHIPFKVIRKLSQNSTSLESLFYGLADWLNEDIDQKTAIWKREFEFIIKKYQLEDVRFRPQFFRLRPANFPTIRLSQLAVLYHKEQSLFSKIIKAEKIEDFYTIFEKIDASEYWSTHYNFGKETKQNNVKKLSRSFIDLILINTILPIKYTYHRFHKEEINDTILAMYQQIKPEKNTIVEHFKSLSFPTPSALDTQAYIYHYKNFCQKKKCLNCSVGYQILKKTIS